MLRRRVANSSGLDGRSLVLFDLPLKTTLVPTRSTGSGTPTFARATTATVMGYAADAVAGSSLTLLTVASGEARFQGARRVSQGVWSPVLADGSAISDATLDGYLAEGARTNIALYSRDLTNAVWSAINCTVANTGGLASDGTVMGRVTSTIAGNRLATSGAGIAIAASTTYTVSYEVRAASSTFAGILYSDNGTTPLNSGGAIFSLTGAGYVVSTTGTGSPSARITLLSTGLYLIELTHTSGAGATTCGFGVGVSDGSTYASSIHPSATSGTIDASAVQIEVGAFASSRIPTTTAAVTRNADVLTYVQMGNLDGARGTLYLEYEPLNGDYALMPGNGALIKTDGANALMFAHSVFSGVRATDGTVDVNGPDGLASGASKVAVSWGPGGLAVYGQGGKSSGSFDGSVAGTTIEIAASALQSSAFVGAIRNLRIYSRALPDSTLQGMTT